MPREPDYQRGLAAVSAFIRAMQESGLLLVLRLLRSVDECILYQRCLRSQDFYTEFVPLRAYAAANMSFCLQAGARLSLSAMQTLNCFHVLSKQMKNEKTTALDKSGGARRPC